MIAESSHRTRVLHTSPQATRLLKADDVSGRSQYEIKSRLETLWKPSRRPRVWLNYSGLLATRYAQLNTSPSAAFVPGELAVQHLESDTQVSYIAAFHPGRRLPLVIGISGINGTVDGKITVDILQSLYDTGAFHVVHLESLTSVSHQARNRRPFLGGFPEGLLLYQVAAELRTRPEFADAIAQVHLVGVSYGGMLCGVAAHCDAKFRHGVIDGAVLALSPPLDLRTLLDNLTVNRIVHDKVENGYLDAGVKRLYEFEVVTAARREMQPLDFDTYMRRVAFPHFQKVYGAVQSDYPDLPPVRDPEELYAISSLRPLLESLDVPYMMVVAYDDPVVSPQDHFARVLRHCTNPLVDGILVPDGGHLGFDAVAGFPFTSQLAIEYFRYWSPPARPDAIQESRISNKE